MIKGVWKYADSFLMEKRGCIMGEKKKIYLASPTMNGQEMRFIQEAFETNWVAPLGKNVDEF